MKSKQSTERRQAKPLTWGELADLFGVDLVDITGDREEAEDMEKQELFRCILRDDLVENLNENFENNPLIRAINRSLEAVHEQPYRLVWSGA